jgi:hypothetical protein
MNCDSFLCLLHEVPIPRWLPEQEASAAAHCLSCENCQIQLQQQQQLLAAFDEMVLPAPSAAIQPPPELAAQQVSSWSGRLQRRLSSAVVLFLCVGSALQLFRESGFSWYWVADGRRLEAVSTLLFNSPLLSVTLTLAGLVYCLARNTRGTLE